MRGLIKEIRYKLFCHICAQVRCYCNQYLLSFIVIIMYWIKFLYELYSNSRVLIHYIEGHCFILFFVSIIGCNKCSYLLIIFCTFKFSSMTLSLSLLHVHWILCYRIKNISFMVFIKQLKPKIFVQCNGCYTEWSLAFKREDPLPGTGRFFLPFFSSTSFLPFLTLRCVFTQEYAHMWSWSRAFIWRAFLP